MTLLSFETIDLERHRDACIKHRRDSYVVSFADGHERFEAENGPDGHGYIEWLESRINDLPEGCVHAWLNDVIVGQIESRVRDDHTGYVNLFYLIPSARGRGLGRELHAYAISLFSSLDIAVARLTVSVENERAMGYYRHLGWRDMGFRPGRNDSCLFEIAIEDVGL